MSNLDATPGPAALQVLIVDPDPRFLKQARGSIAGLGHRCRTARSLDTALEGLDGGPPDLVVIERRLVCGDGEPLDRLAARAPDAPILLTDTSFETGAGDAELPDAVFGCCDKSQGPESLRMWVRAATRVIRHVRQRQKTPQGLRYMLDAVPELYRSRSLDDVLEGILWQIEGLVGGESSFLAARVGGKPEAADLDGFIAFPTDGEEYDDYIVRAATGRYRSGVPVNRLSAIRIDLIRRAVGERRFIIGERCSVFPLALGEAVLGVAYLDRPPLHGQDVELLELFASQAAAAIENATLYALATVDSTTRVFLKAFTLERLSETLHLAQRQGFPVTVVMLDVDEFKKLNDRHGHLVGDRALRYLGRVLLSTVRRSDVVGRFGGDEFLITLMDSPVERATGVVDRLAASLAADGFDRPAEVPPVSISAGLASIVRSEPDSRDAVPDFDRAVETLVAAADAAMYRAKRGAKTYVVGPVFRWADFERDRSHG